MVGEVRIERTTSRLSAECSSQFELFPRESGCRRWNRTSHRVINSHPRPPMFACRQCRNGDRGRSRTGACSLGESRAILLRYAIEDGSLEGCRTPVPGSRDQCLAVRRRANRSGAPRRIRTDNLPLRGRSHIRLRFRGVVANQVVVWSQVVYFLLRRP